MPPSNSAAGIYPLHNLMAAAGEMSEACLKVANFIIDNPGLVSSMSIGELAKATESSQTMIVRVAKLSGYLGYRELRAALIEYSGAVRGANLIRVDPRRDSNKAETFSVLSREIVKVTIEALQDTLRISEEDRWTAQWLPFYARDVCCSLASGGQRSWRKTPVSSS